MPQPIELVLFDAGGVLLLPDVEQVRSALGRSGPPARHVDIPELVELTSLTRR